jgi:glyoxylase I family protein
MPFKPLGLDHVVLQVRDPAAARKFYTEIIGCTLERENKEMSILHMRFGEQLIDLIPGAGADDATSKRGLEHFCLSISCDDMAGLVAWLRARDVEIVRVNDRYFGAYGDGPSVYLRDPDGYMVELKPR